MTFYAKIDENSKVLNVIVAEREVINSGLLGDVSLWVRTSTRPSYRGKFPAVGDTWDTTVKAFVSPKPYPSWYLSDSYHWKSPVNRPEDTDKVKYVWQEEILSWVGTFKNAYKAK